MAPVVVIIFCLAVLFSMVGLGGAILYVPLLKWFGYDFKSVAIPTGLFLNGVTALSAALYYLRARMVDVSSVLPMAVLALIGAPVGAMFTPHVPTGALIILFSAGMLAAATHMWFSSDGTGQPVRLSAARRTLIMAGAGLLIGFFAGLLGIGGGSLFMPVLIAVGYPAKRAAASSAFVVVFPSLSGFAAHAAEGRYHWPLLLACTIAVIVASQVGAKLMRGRMKARWIKRAFSVVLLFGAVKLLCGVLSAS